MVLWVCLYLNIDISVKPLCLMALSYTIFQGIRDNIIV